MTALIKRLMTFFGLSFEIKPLAKCREFDLLMGETKSQPELGRQLLRRWSGYDGRDARERGGDDALRDLLRRS